MIMESLSVENSRVDEKVTCATTNEENANNIETTTDGDKKVAVNTAETIDASSPSADKGSSSSVHIFDRENGSPTSESPITELMSSPKLKEKALEPVFSNGPVFPARHNGELIMSPAYGQSGVNRSNSISRTDDDDTDLDIDREIHNKDKIYFDYDVGGARSRESGEISHQVPMMLKGNIRSACDSPVDSVDKNDVASRETVENESLAPLSASLFNCQYQTPSWIDDPLIGVPPSAMENKNTHRKTGADMRILTAYMRSLNEMRLPEAIPPEELDKYLSSFFLVVRKADGSEYEPCSLRAMLASIERYLRFKNYPLSLTRDSAFSNMRNVLKLKQQTLRSIGKGQKNQSEVTPTSLAREGKIAHLFKSQEMGPYTPSSLVFTLCFYFCMYLRLRKSTENKKLLWGDIVLCKDDSGREFLTFSSQMLQRTQGSTKLNLRQRSYRIWADPSCPEKDPITIYKFYEQKRPISMNTNIAPFYLGINVLYPTQGQLWYRPAAMGINKLNEMVRQIRDMTGIRSTSEFHGDILIGDKGSEGEGSTQGEQSPSSESAERQDFDIEPKQEVDDMEDEVMAIDRHVEQLEPSLDCSQNSEKGHVISSHATMRDTSSVHGTLCSDGDSNDSFTPPSYPSQAGSAAGDTDMGHELDLSNSVNSPLNCTTHARDQRSATVNGIFNSLPSDVGAPVDFLSLADAKEQLVNIVKNMEASDVILFDGWLKKVAFRPDPFSGKIVCKEYDDDLMKVDAVSKPCKQGANITLNISLSHEALKGEGPITVTTQTLDASLEHAANLASSKTNFQASRLPVSSSTPSAKTVSFPSSSSSTSSPLNTTSADKPLDLATSPLSRGSNKSLSYSSSQPQKSHGFQGVNGIFPGLSAQTALDQPLAKRLRLSAEQAEAYSNASLMASLSSTNLVNEHLKLQLMQAGFRTGDYNFDTHSQSILELANSEAFRSQFLQHYGIKTEPK